MTKNKNYFLVEMTDTFGGEPNYSWVRRMKVSANTMRGAVNKISRDTGLSWRKTADFGNRMWYDSLSGATCFFIELYDESLHDGEDYKIVEL